MTRRPPQDGPGQRSSFVSRVEWPALRRTIAARGRAGCRHLRALWPLLALGAAGLAIVFTSDAPSIYALAVALGTMGIAIGVRLSAVSGPSVRIAVRMRDPGIIFCALGAVLHLFLMIRVLTEPANGYDIALWTAGMTAFGASFVNPSALRDIRFRLPLADSAIVATLMLACIALHAHDLRDWYYAAIGDDIGFFLRVREILESGIRDPFSIDGLYGNSPMLNSIYQASVSWIFGGGAWGWKFSSVLSVAITVPAIYGLGRLFANRIAGIVAAAVLICSHYVMAFTHIGYTHLDSLPVIAWATLAFIVGNRRKSAPVLFAAGVLAGLGFYTALPARVILPLLAVWLLINRVGLRRLAGLWPVALGFAVCALPFLVTNGAQTFLVMGLDTISPNSRYGSEIGSPFDRIASNLEHNLLVWWWNDHMSHYTSGSLLDVVSGILVIAGIGVAVGKWRSSDKLLLVWLLMTVAATAVAVPYSHPPLTRMHSTLIPLALLSGVGVSECLNWVRGYRPYKYVAVAGLLMVILALNVWRFQVTTPNALPHYTPESLAVKAWQSEECGQNPDTLFIGRDGHLLDLVLLTYIPEGERPKVIEYEDPLALSPWRACKIFFRPDDSQAQRKLQTLKDVFSMRSTVVANPSGHTYVEVVR